MPLNSYVRENGDIVVTSGGRLVVETAAEFARIVREALEATKSVVIEFEPDVEIDVTGLQTLCSACKSAALSDKVFACKGERPQALKQIIADCGAERNAACKHNNDSTCIWFGGAN